ncbi:Molybdopterin-guanine dinucleotide biosynthesis adapter protein [Candidatus Calditenuaceae archaeon HR02]|nr:Molybdopterin-guanine dinucleotide biosynthesis adapter protein [Candidatus Calditenuaceae archaeon HR02]
MTLLVAVFGRKKAGKTRTIEMLVHSLRREGVRVGVAKHVHHPDFTIDTRGKDSWRFTEAGAQAVYIISPNEWAVIHKAPTDYSEAGLLKLLSATDVDVLFMEGFYDALSKSRRVVKLVVGRDSGEVSSLLAGCEDPILGCVIASDVVDPDLSKNVKTYRIDDGFDRLVDDLKLLLRQHRDMQQEVGLG